MRRGPVGPSEGGRRGAAGRRRNKQTRAEYLREVRERAEWAIAFLKYAEAAGHPIVFRKADLVALRKFACAKGNDDKSRDHRNLVRGDRPGKN